MQSGISFQVRPELPGVVGPADGQGALPPGQEVPRHAAQGLREAGGRALVLAGGLRVLAEQAAPALLVREPVPRERRQ